MTARIFRSFGGGARRRQEHVHPAPDTAEHIDPEDIFDYDRLMRVTITNSFYNVTNSLSPDFTAKPTANTKSILRALDMLVRDEGAGFSILYNKRRKEELIRYVQRHYPGLGHKETDTGSWLAFTLTLRNPNFYYFTDIPFDIDVTHQCYYVNNQMAHDVNNRIILGVTQYLPQSKPFETVEGQRDEPFPDQCTQIVILNAVGEPVQCYPRDVPQAMLDEENIPFITCSTVADYTEKYQKKHGKPPEMAPPRKTCTINFYLLPSGYYTICFIGDPTSPPVAPDQTVVYRGASNEALCFIALFLAAPHEDGPGIFPINFTPTPEIAQVDYWIDFQARSSFWDYFIVPPRKGATLHDLKIVTTRNGGQIPFSPATKVDIGLGTTAYRTMSEVPLLLQSVSEYAFRLTGSIQDSKGMVTTHSTLMPHLPVASPNGTTPFVSSDPLGGDAAGEQPVVDPAHGKSAIYYPTHGKSAIYVYL